MAKAIVAASVAAIALPGNRQYPLPGMEPNRLNRALPVAAVLLIVLIGPATYLLSRYRALDAALARIHPGDTPQQVLSILGKPQQEVPLAGADSTAVEFHYRAWPLPGEWLVRFKSDRVVSTARR
jgi:hypothetical protein